MCGIAGIFTIQGIKSEHSQQITKMNQLQKHRGPDMEGLWHDDVCFLGHRRLSIIDLSKDGQQPFVSDDGRYFLVYNGEIYNYLELRLELEQLGWKFKTKTDTEVLLKSYLQYGHQCLNKFNGMFAFVIYDTKAKNLFLARDRFGIKPLYYIEHENTFYFASEIKALRCIPGVSQEINQQAVFEYLVFNRTDVDEETFWSQVKRFPKGHFGIYDGYQMEMNRWWTAEKFLYSSKQESFADACRQINDLINSSVQLRLRSDVRVGSCLSGGVDSSILVGNLFAQGLAKKDYPTFTASFPGDKIDETNFIDLLNRQYPFKSFRTFPNAEQAYQQLEDFIYTNEEPTSTASFYAQYEVMKLARAQEVTVLLDGQGADELFAGYQYLHGFYHCGLLRKRKFPQLGMELLKTLSRRQGEDFFQTFIFQMLPDHFKKDILYSTVPFLSRDFYDREIKESRIFNRFFDAFDLNTALARHFQYKLEHLLRMEDRNSMRFSIEARLPYLDYRLVEYVLGLPESWKIKSGETKFLQKQALGQYSLKSIIARKDKIGFDVPSIKWLNTTDWRNKIKDSFQYCQKVFSGIFSGKLRLEDASNQLQWKLVQLAVWHQQSCSYSKTDMQEAAICSKS